MGIISWITVGLIVGILAKLLVPEDDPGGINVTILIGMLGGGGRRIGREPPRRHRANWLQHLVHPCSHSRSDHPADSLQVGGRPQGNLTNRL